MRRKFDVAATIFKYTYDKLRRITVVAALLFTYNSSNAQITEPVTDSAKAVLDSLDELDTDQYQDDPPKEVDPGYFLKKWMPGSTLDSVNERYLPDSLLKAIKRDKDFWYADSVYRNRLMQMNNGTVTIPDSNWKKMQAKPVKEREVSSSSFANFLLWILIIGGFLIFLILYLSNSNVKLFSRKNKVIGTEAEEVETEDIFAINYQKEIDKAAASGNYRLAIRLMFLRLLKQLAEKNIIQYKQDKTNFDYLVQLRPTAYYEDFFRLTRNYEYSWYGQFDVSADAYKTIKEDFEKFNSAKR